MKRYRYVIAKFGHYFKIKGGMNQYNRLQRAIFESRPKSLNGFLNLLREQEIHYIVLDNLF